MTPKQLTIPLRSAPAKAVYREILAIRDEVDSILERDPAATGRAEVLLLYSGLHALLMHRVAHRMQKKGWQIPARAVSQLAKFLTGIEIHPGATIGKGLFIDHGSGVVIGETAIVGDNCTIYQGVTLGGTGKQTGKRHPTLGDNVMVGAGAKLLGNFTVGSGSRIAAGAVVLADVPENATAVGVPAKVVRVAGKRVERPDPRHTPSSDLDQVNIPNPYDSEIRQLRRHIALLEERLGLEPLREDDTIEPDGSGI
ncbi:MAG: serine O-acetyltransferase [Clostridia bacterium]|nr:serine O-acetyltransferase [Clostridia bacterium]